MKTEFTLYQNVNLVLADPWYNTRSAQAQAGSAHIVSCKEDTEDTVRLVSNVMAPRARVHSTCSDLMFRWTKSLRRLKSMAENLEAEFERSRKSFCMASRQKARLSSTQKSPGFTTVFRTVETCFTHSCQKLPSSFGGAV